VQRFLPFILKLNTKESISLLLILLLLFISFMSKAQVSAPLKPIICYENGENQKSHIAFDRSKFRMQKLSEFEVTYEGVPQEAVKAFDYAVQIWESLLPSAVPIRVRVKWASLEESSLASSGASKIFRDFHSRALKNVWYPVPLAEKIVGRDLNETSDPDINITLNSNVEWYFGTDGNTFENYIDFVSIVLHELAHGLGIISTAEVIDVNGTLRESDYLLIYDYFLENRDRIRLSSHKSPSKELLREFTSDDLYFHGQKAALGYNNRYPKIFAPINFDAGSSISHLDEDAFPPGDPNSLMSPRFARGEAIHDPGQVLLGILSDIGWQEESNLNDKNDVILFPNQSQGIFTLSFPDEIGSVEIRIIDVTGREIAGLKDRILNRNQMRLDLSVLSNGLYQVIIKSWMGNFNKKLIILN